MRELTLDDIAQITNDGTPLRLLSGPERISFRLPELPLYNLHNAHRDATHMQERLLDTIKGVAQARPALAEANAYMPGVWRQTPVPDLRTSDEYEYDVPVVYFKLG